MAPPKLPSSTDKKTLLDELDGMTAEQLADYFYALAEEIISNPREYFQKMGMDTQEFDLSQLDNIDLSTPAGRRKLAALFRMLAMQVISKGKDNYLSSVTDKSKQQNRTR